jgi:formyltetrahydrofolate deformylase
VLVMVSKMGHCLNDLIFRWRAGSLGADIVAVVSNHG